MCGGRRQNGRASFHTFTGRSGRLADLHLPIDGFVLGTAPAAAGRRPGGPTAATAAKRCPLASRVHLYRRCGTTKQFAGTHVFKLLTGRLGVSVLLVSLQSRPVLLLPYCEVGQKWMVWVGVGLVEVVAGQRGHGARLVGVVVVERVWLVFVFLVPLLAARSLLHFGPFLACVFAALGSASPSPAAVCLPAT